MPYSSARSCEVQGPSVTNALPPDLNPKVLEVIAKNTGVDVGTLKGSDSLPASNPTLAAPSRAKPRSAHTAKPSSAARPTSTARPSSTAQPSRAAAYSRSPSPDFLDDGADSPHQDVAEVRTPTLPPRHVLSSVLSA